MKSSRTARRCAEGAGPVLQGLDVDIGQHEMVAMLGANGAGKSTLMRAIAGLHRPLQGSIDFAGEELSALPAHQVVARGVVLVPEGRQVFTPLSVEDNLRLGAFRRKDDGVRADLEQIYATFPLLAEKRRAAAGSLSGGQQQRVAIARALAIRPKLLLFDEPTSALDPELVGEVLDVVREMKNTGMTMLLATHEMAFAREIADRVCFLHEGRVLEQGAPNELFGSPRHERTRTFLQRVLDRP